LAKSISRLIIYPDSYALLAFYRKEGQADVVRDLLKQAARRGVVVSRAAVLAAAELKAQGRLSYADCILWLF
jgi:hypothetical protein